MKKVVLAVLLSLLLPSVNAETSGQGSPLDKRIKTAIYSKDNVYRLNAMKNRTSSIQFPPGETINLDSGLIVTGNPNGWTLGANKEGNMVAIKPKNEAVDPETNFIINTNKNTYIIDVRLTDNASLITYLLRFDYPAPPKPSDNPFTGRELIKNPCDGAMNRDYQKRGDVALSPAEVWDNGTFTCMRFPTNAPRPVIYQVLPDGTETLINSHQVNDIVVIHGTSALYKLRLNKLVMGIKTDSHNTGYYNYNGTTTGEIKRVKDAGK